MFVLHFHSPRLQPVRMMAGIALVLQDSKMNVDVCGISVSFFKL
jgi:hypothetical protein